MYLVSCLDTDPDSCVLDPTSREALLTIPDEKDLLQLQDRLPFVLLVLYEVSSELPTVISSCTRVIKCYLGDLVLYAH